MANSVIAKALLGAAGSFKRNTKAVIQSSATEHDTDDVSPLPLTGLKGSIISEDGRAIW